MDQRLHVRHVPAGVGNLVGRPDAEHCFRSEQTAEKDEHDGNGSTPAPPTAAWASLLLVEFGCLGAEAFQLGSLIRGKRCDLASRLRLTVGIGHAHLAVTSAAPAAQRRVDAAVPVLQDLLGTASIQPVWPDADLPHPARMNPAGVVFPSRCQAPGRFAAEGGSSGAGRAGSWRRRTSTTFTPRICSRARSPCSAA